MAWLLRYALWFSTAFGAVSIAVLVVYTVLNDSRHTGWEPLGLLLIFVPLLLFGAAALFLRSRFPGIARLSICALVVGFLGVALIVTLDRTNRLVKYERWIKRGMP